MFSRGSALNLQLHTYFVYANDESVEWRLSQDWVPVESEAMSTKIICVSTFEPRHVISNNVEISQVYTQTSLCSLPLSLETPKDVWLYSSLILIEYSSD